MIEAIKLSLSLVRQKKPLILCLTNYVTMDFMANCILALGAAPLMSESIDEIQELVTISQSVYLNIGTLNSIFLERACFAAQAANSLHKPIILDPVGSGASQLRTTAAQALLPLASVIRGNASEIISLSGAIGHTQGVETSQTVQVAIEGATSLAQTLQKIIVISGPEDFITDGRQNQTLNFGSNLMPFVTGMGCSMTAVLSAFVASDSNHYKAATHATAFFGLCGQLAHQQTKAPGSFKSALIDNLFNPDWDFFENALQRGSQ